MTDAGGRVPREWIRELTGHLGYRDGAVTSYHRLETDWSTSFRDATFDFIDAIVDHRPARLDAAEGRKTLVFSLAAQRSAAEHREVALSEISSSEP